MNKVINVAAWQKCLLSLLAVVMVLGVCAMPAKADDNPVGAVRSFFNYAVSGNNSMAWNIMSKGSRDIITSMIISECEKNNVTLSADEIQADFEHNGEVSRAFWEALLKEFKKATGPVDVNSVPWMVKMTKGNTAVVGVEGNDEADFIVVNESGWHIAIMESMRVHEQMNRK